MATLYATPPPPGQLPQHVCYLCTRKFADATALSTHETCLQFTSADVLSCMLVNHLHSQALEGVMCSCAGTANTCFCHVHPAW